MPNLQRLALFVPAFLLLLGGCSTTAPLIGNPEMPYPVDNPKVGDLVHLETGHKLRFEQMIEALARTRVIYIGETHDNPASHRLQVDVLRALEKRNPGQLALGMEMFTPAQQPVLDRWVAGDMSEEQFLRDVDWFTNWRMNFALYRGLLELCREQQIPIIALNAPKKLVRQVGRTPLENLPEEVRQDLPKFDFDDPYQRAMTQGIYSGHSMGKAMSDGFIRVQTLWDETMAQSLADYLVGEGQGRQVVVVAGGNHVRYGFGIPRRLHRRLPLSYALIGSREIEIPKERESQLMDVELPHFPMRPWDYLLLTRYETLNIGVKLGIALVEEEGKLKAKMVMPGSAAEKAGLQKDDLLLKAGEEDLGKQFDLLYLLMNLKKGAKLSLEIERDGERRSLEVEF